MIGGYLPRRPERGPARPLAQPNRGPLAAATRGDAAIVEIAPFRGLRYDPTRVDADAVIAPPYDVVGEDEVAALLARSPYNIARVESPRGGEERFEAAAQALRDWEAEGVLLRDETPSLYAYEQVALIEGEQRRRRGYFARLRLTPFEAREVLPHERTMAAPKAERLALMQATQANVSPISVIAGDAAGVASALLAGVAERAPAFEAKDGRGDEHRLWVIDEPSELARLVEAAAATTVTIADGHHRYETALSHLADRDEEGRRWMLACLVAEDDPGLVVLPAHRLVAEPQRAPDFTERLEQLYSVEALPPDIADLADPSNHAAAERLWEQVRAAEQPGTFGVIGLEGASLHLLRPRSAAAIDAAMPAVWSAASRSLDVLILTETILGPLLGIDAAALAGGSVAFSEDVGRAWDWALAGQERLAFLVNPTRIEQMNAVIEAGDVLPQKSTFFYPKLATGMVLNRLD